MDKIYTKTGDQGFTKLGTGNTVRKTDTRVEAYGTVDELSSFVGLAISTLPEADVWIEELVWIQQKLFVIASLLAFPGREVSDGLGEVTSADLERLEQAIDRMTEELSPLTSFILPGGVDTAAALHCARSVCRRAERQVTKLDFNEYPLGDMILPFINRLSDYLFTAARFANYRKGFTDRPAKETNPKTSS